MALIDQFANKIQEQWTYPEPGETGSLGPYRVVSIDLLLGLDVMPGGPPPVGVLVAPETSPEVIVPYLDRIELVVVSFPKFRDGRGFTIARTLRERHGFKGDIRALGHVLPDQLPLLAQCGFSSIVTPEDHPPSQWKYAHFANRPGEARPQPLLQRLVRPRD